MENRQAALEQVGQLLLATWSERDPEATLRNSLARLLEQLQAQMFCDVPISSAIMIHDDRTGYLKLAAADGPLKTYIESIEPSRSGTTVFVYNDQQPLYVDNVNDWPPSVPSLRDNGSLNDVQSFAILPLYLGEPNERIDVGVLTVSSQELYEFTVERRNSLKEFATMAAIAVQAARVRRRRLREQDSLSKIIRDAVHGDLMDISLSIAQQAVQITQSSYAAVFNYNRKSNLLSSLGVFGATQDGDGATITLPLSEKSINTHVFNLCRSYYAQDVSTDAYYQHYGPWDSGFGSAYCVPLIARGVTIGTLYVASEQQDGFNEFERHFIDQLAPYATNAMRNVWLRETIVRFQQSITNILSVDEQFVQIRAELEDVGYNTNGLFIAQFKPDSQWISFPKVRDRGELIPKNDPRKAVGGLYESRKLGERNGLVDWVLTERRSLLIRDFSKSRRAQMVDAEERDGIRSCVVVPLFLAEQIVGVLGLRRYDDSGNGRYDDYDRLFLESVANHIAVVLDNSAWRVREEEQRKSLERIKRFQENIAGTLSLNEQMEQISVEFQQLGMTIDGLFIATYDDATKQILLPKIYEYGELVDDAQKAASQKHGPRKLGDCSGFIDWVIENRKTLFIPDLSQWDQAHEVDKRFHNRVTSCLITPILRQGKIVGVIGLRSYNDIDRLQDYDRQFLEKTANLLGTVIDNSQKFDSASNALRRRFEDVRAISAFQEGISNIDVKDGEFPPSDLINITDNPEEAYAEINPPDFVQRELENIYEQALAALGKTDLDTQNMYIALCDDRHPNKISFPLLYENGARISGTYRDAYQDRELGIRLDLTEWIIRYGNDGPLLFRDRKEMVKWRNQAGHANYHLPEKSQSWVGAPLRSRSRTIGMIGLRNFEKENAFTEEHRNLLQIIANQSGIVIENARLYQLSQKRLNQLTTLYDAANKISRAGLEVKNVLDRILQQAVHVTGASVGTIRYKVGNQLELGAVWPLEYTTQLMESFMTIPISGLSITSRAVRANKYQIVNDTRKETEYRVFVPDMRSELAVTLKSYDTHDVVGVLNVEHTEVNQFDRDDAHLLIALSNLAVLAIENAELYKKSGQTNTIAIMGAWGAEIVHDVNREAGNIDATLVNISDMLENSSKEWLSKDELRQHLEEIENSIINLTLPELPDGPPSPQGLLPTEDAPLLNSVVEAELERQRDQARQAESGAPIKLAFCADCDDVRINMNELWFRRILNHFVQNGIRNMPEERINPHVYVTTRVENEMAVITITDNGKGVRPEIRDNLFRMPISHVGQAADQRLGRGLLLVDFVLTQHRGQARLRHSEVGEGSEFVVKIPLADY